MPSESRRPYYIARLDGLDVAGVGPLPDGIASEAFWTSYVCVQSADETATLAKEAGGRLAVQPFDMLSAGRMAAIADPSGALFCIWEPKEHRGAELVNAAGAWNWSELHTRDLDDATRFYQALFGWETSVVQVGADEAIMWLLPGYADFLERLDPGIRRRHEEYGAPEVSFRPTTGRW